MKRILHFSVEILQSNKVVVAKRWNIKFVQKGYRFVTKQMSSYLYIFAT